VADHPTTGSANLQKQCCTTKPIPCGTGFITAVKRQENPNRAVPYVVTNKHVLRTPELPNQPSSYWPRISLRFNLKGGGVENIPVNLRINPPQKNVFVHNDSTVDLAVLPAGAIINENRHDFASVTEDELTTGEDLRSLYIGEGTPVFFTGLFMPHTGEQKNYPIIRSGKVALITDEQVNWNGTLTDLYLMEVSSYGGNSGSPVFFYIGAERRPSEIRAGPPILKLAGIMKGHFNEISPVFIPPQNQMVAVTNVNNGIAAVIPAYKLRELLFSPEVLEARR
jgi:hypothetical protein